MKLKSLNQHCRGFTLTEGLVIIVVVAVLMGWLLQPQTGSSKAQRPYCLKSLKQCGLALAAWADDHGGKFPFQVSTNQGGSLEYTSTKDVFRHFLSVSNELGNPKMLACPADPQRLRADTFSSFGNQNLSYFLVLNSTRSSAWSVLAGDRNIAANQQKYSNGNYLIPASQSLTWDAELHNLRGNLVFSDGHAEQCDNPKLATRMSNTRQTANWLAFP